MVEIVPFSSKFSTAFKELNYEWISELFKIESEDIKVLSNPQSEIIDKGGHILIALKDGEPLGTCALLKADNQEYELAKMAVLKNARGQKIGWKLGQAIIEKAKEIGAKKLFLQTNSSLGPAIALYQKLGFKSACGADYSFSRCDIKMEIPLS